MRSLTRWFSIGLVGAALTSGGCWVHGGDDTYSVPPNNNYDFAVPDLTPTLPVIPVVTDAGAFYGSEAPPPDFAALSVFHVYPGAGVTVPPSTSGFVVTADGLGAYRLAWVNSANLQQRVHGSIFTAGVFTQVTAAGMAYELANSPNRIDFEVQPGATEAQIDLVSSTDPIYIDVLLGSTRGAAPTYYSDGTTGATLTTSADPVGFTSP